MGCDCSCGIAGSSTVLRQVRRPQRSRSRSACDEDELPSPDRASACYNPKSGAGSEIFNSNFW